MKSVLSQVERNSPLHSCHDKARRSPAVLSPLEPLGLPWHVRLGLIGSEPILTHLGQACRPKVHRAGLWCRLCSQHMLPPVFTGLHSLLFCLPTCQGIPNTTWKGDLVASYPWHIQMAPNKGALLTLTTNHLDALGSTPQNAREKRALPLISHSCFLWPKAILLCTSDLTDGRQAHVIKAPQFPYSASAGVTFILLCSQERNDIRTKQLSSKFTSIYINLHP